MIREEINIMRDPDGFAVQMGDPGDGTLAELLVRLAIRMLVAAALMYSSEKRWGVIRRAFEQIESNLKSPHATITTVEGVEVEFEPEDLEDLEVDPIPPARPVAQA